ncbi:enoyl-[acyl-carrier-protein] reductase FabK [Senegalia massiliensis]|uniref:Probable nitronate monooxygenase n=1 Tax=Senegalia massiliensis TaxID=1720316 RepID=A0A845QX52_9CLOT|nr:enoyl-[acyl-carrier-protein] reductase FabK [Senegalia massiliensis]NBI06861.1 enoyl-[acyl-carrier-protein] reductase FabK [Senegalia massiliensis]
MFENRLVKLLGVKYPIIQGGMAWVATAELAAAVSNAGGLGIIGCGAAPVEVVKQEILKAKEMTDKPFGVNVMLLSPHADSIMEMLYDEKISVVTTGAGNPGKYIDKLKNVGTKVIPVVPSVALAKRMEKLGADAVIVEGTEAGGHIGELTTFAIVPQVVDNVDIPVIAAGGIADGRGFMAAISLGAEGVQIGTRFVCSNECIAHDQYKEKIVNSKDRDAIVTGRITGHPVRIIKNKLSRKIINLEKDIENKDEIDKLTVGSLKKAAIDGDVTSGSVMAGQSSGLIKDIKSCKEIIDDIITEVEDIKGKLYKF